MKGVQGISGLQLIENFISLEEEATLLENIDNSQWNNNLIRRTQHYGYMYDYTSRAAAEKTVEIPEWCQFLLDRLMERELIKTRPDQLIINEYLPGQGIFSHVDSIQSFEDGIVSISLNSDIIMDFVNNKDKRELLLPRRSALVLHEEARYDWRHGIAARKKDYKKPRGRRVSLTFRKMK